MSVGSHYESLQTGIMSECGRKHYQEIFLGEKTAKIGVMVWACINSDGELLYHIFKESVKADSYHDMLQSKFSLMNMKKYWFMQDGAGPHYANKVKNMLNKKYPRRWIGKGSYFQTWQPRSPELTPCDFFLWGYLKHRIALRRPSSKNELIETVKKEFEAIPRERIALACRSVTSRMEKCLDVEGSQVR